MHLQFIRTLLENLIIKKLHSAETQDFIILHSFI